MSADVVIEVRRLPHAEGLALPAYQTEHAAGLDLVAAVGEQAPLTLAPGATRSRADWPCHCAPGWL